MKYFVCTPWGMHTCLSESRASHLFDRYCGSDSVPVFLISADEEGATLVACCLEEDGEVYE